jgi:ribonucleoside-diphosphate reductase beta chain
MQRLGLAGIYGSADPLDFTELQDVQELSNFCERKVSAYQVGVSGAVGFDEDF